MDEDLLAATLEKIQRLLVGEKLEEAIRTGEEFLGLHHSDEPAAASVGLELAYCHYMIRSPESYARANQCAADAATWFRGRQPIEESRSVQLRGLVAMRLWRRADARRHLQRALQLVDANEAPDALAQAAKVHDSLGQYWEWVGARSEAVPAYSTSLALKTVVDDHIGLGITLHNLGRLHTKFEDWTAAQRLLHARMHLARQSHDNEAQLASAPLLALTLSKTGRGAEAYDSIEAAIALARSSGRRSSLAYALKAAAEIAIDAGASDLAKSYANEGIEILQSLADPVGQGHLERCLGEAEELQGDLVAARTRLEHAAELLRGGDDIIEETAALIALVRVCRKAGEKGAGLAAADLAVVLSRQVQHQRRESQAVTERERLLRLPGLVELQLWVDWKRPHGDSTIAVTSADREEVRLRLLRELGRGGFGIVYEAEDLVSGGRFALKRLIVDHRGDSDLRVRRFRREAYAAAELDHPNVVRIQQIDVDTDGSPYLLLELIEGGDLSRLPHQPAQLVEAAAQIAGALAAAHARGIVHRDVKPANILLRTSGEPVLCDFGVAHLPGSSDTRTGEFIGSLEYLPPEAFEGGSATPSWDVFALGVTLAEIWSKRRPYPSGRFRDGTPSFPDTGPQSVQGLPDSVASLLEQMVARDPEQRPTAEQAQARFAAVKI